MSIKEQQEFLRRVYEICQGFPNDQATADRLDRLFREAWNGALDAALGLTGYDITEDIENLKIKEDQRTIKFVPDGDALL